VSVFSQGMQWGFYECEPDIWIVIALDTQISAIEQGESTFYYKHSPNGEGLVQAIQVPALLHERMSFSYPFINNFVGVVIFSENVLDVQHAIWFYWSDATSRS
jgi:hypothetical protein